MYHVGDRIRITTTFTNLAGSATNPTTVVCTVKSPAGATTAPLVSTSGTGVYYAELTLDASGDWRWRMAGTGAVVAADEGIISVERSAF